MYLIVKKLSKSMGKQIHRYLLTNAIELHGMTKESYSMKQQNVRMGTLRMQWRARGNLDL